MITQNSKSRVLYVLGGSWDIIFWKAVFLQRGESFCGDCIVYSKVFSERERALLEELAASSGLSPISYLDSEALLSSIDQKAYTHIAAVHFSDVFTFKLISTLTDAKILWGFEGLSGYYGHRENLLLHTRVEHYYHFSELPMPHWTSALPAAKIEPRFFRQATVEIRERSHLPSLSDSVGKGDGVLVLGQHFHRHRVLDWETELGLYSDHIEQRIAQGCSVFWKEHPRNTQPFSDALKKRFPSGFHVWETEAIYAVELWGTELARLKEACGACSNSLFTLRDLYNVPCSSIVSLSGLSLFNFGKLKTSALINLIGISCLNHSNTLPVEFLINSFQRAESDVDRKQFQPPEKPSLVSRIRRSVFSPFARVKRPAAKGAA